VMLFGLPRRQRLPKSLWELHNSRVAAQTRPVSAAPFRPNPRKLSRQFKWILVLTDSAVRVRPRQPASPVFVGCHPCLDEPATFPRVRLSLAGLREDVGGIQSPTGGTFGHESPWGNFQYPCSFARDSVRIERRCVRPCLDALRARGAEPLRRKDARGSACARMEARRAETRYAAPFTTARAVQPPRPSDQVLDCVLLGGCPRLVKKDSDEPGPSNSTGELVGIVFGPAQRVH
jgi:hypothetical protein